MTPYVKWRETERPLLSKAIRGPHACSHMYSANDMTEIAAEAWNAAIDLCLLTIHPLDNRTADPMRAAKETEA